MGRSDDMLIIKGVNVFPSQIEEVLISIEGCEPHYQLVVDRKGALDTLEVRIEVTENIFFDEMKQQRAFLAGLPLTARMGPDALLVHASADGPERWHYVADSNAAERSMAAATQIDPAIRYVFSGHVHEQALYFLTPTAKLMRFSPQPGVPVPVPPHRQWLAIVGSCGQPRDGDTRAMYALFDAGAATITFQRVRYDHMAAAAAVRASGLPAFFADRLEKGR